ncbi:MAG: Isochorismatase [Candidatus Heimdallarchaeota archaeon AB_125]|nr:MAG: Isochorismatase [Candidatus Heimdallarchaeota archaeon AB_125]
MQKELYLTKENQEEKVSQWITECKKMKKHIAFAFDLSKAALLVLDMQNFFLDESKHAYVPSAKTITEDISKLVDFFQKNERPVIFTKHLDTQKPDEMMTRWWKDSIEDGTPEAEISNLLNTEGSEIIKKSRYSAFEKTNLEELLHNKGVKQIIITGIMSHLCCETTARDAFMKDFEVIYIVDATATYTEKLHLGTIRAISHGFGRCESTEEIVNG